MQAYTEQYELESTWSTRKTDEIIMNSIDGDIPQEMELKIRTAIESMGVTQTDELFVKLFSFILKEKSSKPIQAIATQLGAVAGMTDSLEAFEWGVVLVKLCKNSGLYELVQSDQDDAWYVVPNFCLSKSTKQEIDKLQYLPPMKITPLDWVDNHSGGWLYETKSILLGKKFAKHNDPLAYDVLNKLQKVQWTIDTETYLTEKDTNHNLKKKQFLRVMDEYLGKPFHFVWRYDSRGRSYSSGYHLNIQGNEYGKALISLYNKEKITNFDNMYIAIANHAGLDKLTWQERIDWTSKQQSFDDVEWDEPMLGRKAVRALGDAIAGKKSGYMMSADATSSGVQIMAVLSGCKSTAKLTNCIDPTKRYDLYTEVSTLMNAELTKPVPRAIIKACTMTHYYNSKATPKALLSEEGLEVFNRVIKGVCPGAEEVMEVINSCWDATADAHSWEMPDGHTVYVPVVSATDVTYADSELGEIPLRYYQQAPSDNYRSLAANICHSVDGYVAREMVRRCDFQLAHIHDCFLFPVDHLQDVSRTYREIMAEVAKSDLLQDILRQITNDPKLTITKYSSDLDQDILNSSYMLS